jgi:hypothetical protein
MGTYLLFFNNLGSPLLCITNDDGMMKKWGDFVETKLHLNEHIEWYYVQLELNSNLIFNSMELN